MSTETAEPTIKDRIRDWIELNPLRRWRHRQELSMMDASGLLGVGMSSVQHWEQGAYYPSEESMVKLAAAMGVKVETLARNWRTWYAARATV